MAIPPRPNGIVVSSPHFMKRLELDDFLRKYSVFEELLRYPRGNNDTRPQVLSDSLLIYKDIVGNILNDGNTGKIKTFMDCVTFFCPPRFLAAPLHQHHFIELIYVYSGQCRQIINDVPVVMNTGDICIIGPNVRHSLEAAGENDIIINCLMSTDYLKDVLLGRLSGYDFLANFFIRATYQKEVGSEYLLFCADQSEKIGQLMNDLLCEVFDSSFWSNEVITSYLVLVMSELLSSVKKDIEPIHPSEPQVNFADIIYYIQKNCNEVTLSSAAAEFHFHPNHLSLMLKRLTGSHFTSLLHEARLTKASLLLNNSNIAITEIAHTVGYQNMNFFYRLFKKQFGNTPAEYRKKSKTSPIAG